MFFSSSLFMCVQYICRRNAHHLLKNRYFFDGFSSGGSGWDSLYWFYIWQTALRPLSPAIYLALPLYLAPSIGSFSWFFLHLFFKASPVLNSIHPSSCPPLRQACRFRPLFLFHFLSRLILSLTSSSSSSSPPFLQCFSLQQASAAAFDPALFLSVLCFASFNLSSAPQSLSSNTVWATESGSGRSGPVGIADGRVRCQRVRRHSH